MSRTFRKNKRFLKKVHGEYYSSYRKPNQIRFPLPVKDWELLPSSNTKYYADSRSQYKCTRQEVQVPDHANLKRGLGKQLKQCLTQIDRSRARAALRKAMNTQVFDHEALEDTTPAFNPWDWD